MRRFLAKLRLWWRRPLGKPQRLPAGWSTPGHHFSPCQQCGKRYIDHQPADVLLCREMGEPFVIQGWDS